ncbi:MAG: trigger factor, partial [Limnochordia bacterium]
GEDSLFDGLSDALIGTGVGEMLEVKVTLPERFEELAGKEAILHVEVKEIKERQLPDLDDEFAKDVSSFDTLDEFRADLRKQMEERAQQWADQNMRNNLVDSVCKDAELEVPDLLIRRQASDMINDGALNLWAHGVDPREFLTPENVENLLERYKPEAEEALRRRLVLEAIAEKEGLTVTSDEVEERIETWIQAEESSDRAEEVRTYYEDSERREAVSADLRLEKVIQFLVDNAVITEKVENPEESDPESATETTDQA